MRVSAPRPPLVSLVVLPCASWRKPLLRMPVSCVPDAAFSRAAWDCAAGQLGMHAWVMRARVREGHTIACQVVGSAMDAPRCVPIGALRAAASSITVSAPRPGAVL